MEAGMFGRSGFPFGGFGGQPAEEPTHAASAVPAPSMRFNTLAGGLGDSEPPGRRGHGQWRSSAPASAAGSGARTGPVERFRGARRRVRWHRRAGRARGLRVPARRLRPAAATAAAAGRDPATGLRPAAASGVAFTPPEIFRIDPGIFLPPFRLPPVTKTATQLAESAIVTLNNASPEVVEEALNTLRGRNVAADGLIDYLERRVRVGEVLNQLASTWSDTTVGDFADAFQMDRGKREVMDAIVAVGILNEPELDEEMLIENRPQPSDPELLDNRVIVQQWPPGGTVMQPPYLVLVAVEYRAVAEAQEQVDAIMNQLVEHTGIKLPRPAVERLRARG